MQQHVIGLNLYLIRLLPFRHTIAACVFVSFKLDICQEKFFIVIERINHKWNENCEIAAVTTMSLET